MSTSGSVPVHQSSAMASTLTRILGGTAIQWEAEKSADFNEWWETTDWAGKLRDNLAKPGMPNKNMNAPRWDSKLRTAKHWVHYGQGAKVHSGEPFVYCLGCNSPLQHPSAFNLGTTHMRVHLTTGKCRSTTGRQDQDIAAMFGKVII